MAPRLDNLGGLKMGLLANGKANADVLLNETAALFAAEFGCERPSSWTSATPVGQRCPNTTANSPPERTS